MRVAVIGGTGHIGRFLCPLLVEDGHEVTALARGQTPPPALPGWERVSLARVDYQPAPLGAALSALQPEVLIDILGFGVPGTFEAAYQAVAPTCRQLMVCGSLWMWGDPAVVPTPEVATNPCWAEGYAARFRLYQRLMGELAGRLPFTVIMPPNICGPGKVPLDGMGGRDLAMHRQHAKGEPCPLPAPGSTPIGPCDASDIASAFRLAVRRPERAAGHFFNVGSAYALTAERFIGVYGEIYGVPLPIRWESWQQYSTVTSPDKGAHYHFSSPMCPDITKLRTLLGYEPQFTPEETMARAVGWMRDEGLL